MKDLVKVPTAYLQTWRKNLTELSRKHPMEFPEKMRQLLQEVSSYTEKATKPLQDIPKSKIETWKGIVDIYLSLAIEHFMLPPSLYDLVERIANHLASFTMPHIRCVTGRKAFRIERVKPHFYGGFELALSDSDVIEVDLSPISSCKQLKQLWLVLENVQNIDLSPLKFCADLETLYISIGRARGLDLKPLAECENLRNLDLLVKGLYDLDLAPLGKCAHLRSLNISNTNLNVLSLKPLGNCKELAYLCLDSNSLSELDLAPLVSCQSLYLLSFEKNYLQEIDLEPLAFCESLQYLGMGHNSLSEIDLSPLSGNSKLRKVKMENNRIKEIDLGPLSKANSLASLDIGGNRLDDVDLNPLSGLPALEDLSLNSNSLSSLSTMPLASCKKMKNLDFRRNPIQVLDISGPLCAESKSLNILVDPSTRTEADSILRAVRPNVEVGEESLELNLYWRPIKKLLRESGWKEVNRRIQIYMQNLSGARRFAAKREFLMELGLAEISGVDKDITPLMNSMKSTKSLRSIRSQLSSGIIDLLQEQLDEGGSTFFLDGEILGETDQALRGLITERRAQEMNEVVIPIKKGRVHLEPLWLTVYGFDALKSSNMPLKTTTLNKFKQIKETLAEKGFKLKTIEYTEKRVAKKYSVKMSPELREYILKLAAS